jgi:hypothetical protein
MAKNLTLGVAEYVLLLKDEMSKVAAGAFDSVEKQGESLSNRFNMVGVAATAMGGAIVGGLTMAVASAAESEQAMAQLDAVLKSTGGAAGMTRDELTNLAESLQKVTTYDDEAIIGAESLMLTFTKIGKEVFPQAIATVLDMSTALGQDLQSSTIQLGKALNDPIKGITALSRVGVSFTETQKETIKTMVETGNVLGAQKIILEELSVEFGGSATAAANTLNGALDQLGDSFGNLMEAIGAALLGGEAEGGGLKGFVQDVRDAVDSVTDWIEANPQLASTLTWVTAALGGLLLIAGPLVSVIQLFSIGIIPLTKALFGVGAAASAAAGGTVAGGAAAGVAGAASAAGAVAGGGGLAAFGSALMTATALTATAVIGIGAVSVALAAVGIAAYDYYQANQELEESQKSLDDTERQYIETLKAKGVVIDETRLKGMDEAQQRAYLAAQETAERETLARAWFTYFAERTESETDFARMKNLMLNEAIDAEEAAFLVSKGISADKVQMIMKASQEETDTILRELGYQKNESEATHQAIASSAAGAARDRQEAFINTSIEIAKNEQQLAEVTVSVWDRVIETIKSYTAWIWPQLQEISRFMADMLLPNYVSDYFMPSAPVPGLATGGIVRTGGIVDVHKNERIILPAGSDVVPARHSKQVDAMMNGGGGEININIGTVQMANDMDVREVGRQLGREVKKQLRMRGVTTAFGSA